MVCRLNETLVNSYCSWHRSEETVEFVRCFIPQGRMQYILTAFRFVIPDFQDSIINIFLGIALDHETLFREEVKTTS